MAARDPNRTPSADRQRLVTMVLTEVRDDSRVAAAMGDTDAQERWRRHDALVQGLLDRLGGHAVERTEGTLGLFDETDDALAFARAYLDGLKGHQPPGSARVAMHRGTVVVRDNSPEHVARGAKSREADGVALSLAARVASVTRPGQILATAAARPTAPSHSHGHWSMKGEAEPIELFEIGESPQPQPPEDGRKIYRVVWRDDGWAPVRRVPNNLPAAWDRFVGRADDLRAVSQLLDDARLVSITGVGGGGKTRLALHHARTHLGEYPGGAWFCDLVEARDASDVVGRVAASLDVRLGKGPDVDRVGNAIRGRGPCLLVLDNFEQVVTAARETVSRWLQQAPEARFVVTTRELLGLSEEATLSLGPLTEADAVDFFAARAASVQRGFTVGPENLEEVRALVNLLDRLPLALELAAARTRVMPPKKLLERMTDRFKLLRARQARVERQATLEATLDWSWDLLNEEERDGLVQLSVFDGGLTEEAAAAVVARTPEATLGLLDRLVATS
ncbi:MAG: hypothetical protein AAF211_26215, partial [Myxococcota bacterium]